MQFRDLNGMISNDSTERRKLADDIRSACVRVGFFYVKNHGIPDSVIEGAFEMAKKVFGLPTETKMEIENSKSPNFKGYIPLLSANINPYSAGDLHEGFLLGGQDLPDIKLTNSEAQIDTDSGYNGAMPGTNISPDAASILGLRETIMQYYQAAIDLGKPMFPLFAMALNLPENFFDDKTQHAAAPMKLLRYPPQSGPVNDRAVGIGAHTDWECFTILRQEPGIQALQVLNSEKKWINTPPIPGTFVINVGDQLAYWTNTSILGPLINRSGVRRYSIPLFFGVDYNVKLEPMPSCASPERPSAHEAITSGEYIKARLEETFKH